MSAYDARARRWLWPIIWTVALVFAAAWAAFAGSFIAIGVVAFLGVFAGAYAILSKAISMNYSREGHRPTATWPSDIPPAPPT
jgi:hypothetical protein